MVSSPHVITQKITLPRMKPGKVPRAPTATYELQRRNRLMNKRTTESTISPANNSAYIGQMMKYGMARYAGEQYKSDKNSPLQRQSPGPPVFLARRRSQRNWPRSTPAAQNSSA